MLRDCYVSVMVLLFFQYFSVCAPSVIHYIAYATCQSRFCYFSHIFSKQNEKEMKMGQKECVQSNNDYSTYVNQKKHLVKNQGQVFGGNTCSDFFNNSPLLGKP